MDHNSAWNYKAWFGLTCAKASVSDIEQAFQIYWSEDREAVSYPVYGLRFLHFVFLHLIEYLQCIKHLPGLAWGSSTHLLHLFIPSGPTLLSCSSHLYVWFQLPDCQVLILVISSLIQIFFKSEVLLLSLAVITMSLIPKCDRKSPNSLFTRYNMDSLQSPREENSPVAFSIG